MLRLPEPAVIKQRLIKQAVIEQTVIQHAFIGPVASCENTQQHRSKEHRPQLPDLLTDNNPVAAVGFGLIKTGIGAAHHFTDIFLPAGLCDPDTDTDLYLWITIKT